MTPITDKQKCIFEQMPYRLKFAIYRFEKDEYRLLHIKYPYGISQERNLEFGSSNGFSSIDIHSKDFSKRCKPVLRPLSWLTREISHEGYNDNQPFVPLIELAKKIHPEYKFEINNKGDKVIHYTSDHPYSAFIEIGFDKCLTYCYQVSGDFGYNAHYENIENITECYDLLNLWHFNYRNLPDTDFVSTEEVGDVYAVKTE